jgi:preprotein translocase subunit SecF/SecD/SecF fusion protein
MMRLLPNFKGFDFFPHDTRLPFMRYKGLCFMLSVAGMLISLALFATLGLNYGVDFKGGSMLEVQSKSGPADIAALREKLGKLGIGAVQIQSFGAPTDVLIRVEQQPGGESAQQAALKKVTEALADQYTQRRVEVVGPAVSSELRMTGFIAVAAGLLAIVTYVWFRFEWQFALGAIGQRHRGGVGSHPREFAQIQAHGAQRALEPVDQRDAVAHHLDRLHRHRRAGCALSVRR